MNLISRLYNQVVARLFHKYKKFECGCVGMDNIMIKLCPQDRRCYISCSYKPKSNYYLMEGIEL